MSEGHEGWDDYAPFYDWENARTLGRRDVPFWRSVAVHNGGRVLELGSGTGRISLPLARAGVTVIGIDRSGPMLARARTRVRRAKLGDRISLVRGDIRYLPFASANASRRSSPQTASASDTADLSRRTLPQTASASDAADLSRRSSPQTASASEGGVSMVMAPYGVLQSLLRERDLAAALDEVRRVLEPGGTFGLELVADLPSWQEYRKRISLKGWRHRRGGTHVTLIETVRQDRERRLTIFDQEFTERRGRITRTHRFALTFRTLSVPQMVRRLEKSGFEITATLGDYQGKAWDSRSETWVILSRKVGS